MLGGDGKQERRKGNWILVFYEHKLGKEKNEVKWSILL